MRLLTQPRVLGRAILAAFITSLACCPRLATWTERADSVLFLWLMLLWAMCVLWGFVFAWQFQYANRPAIQLKFQPKLWAMATISATVAAVLLNFLLDPQLRRLTPGDYPVDGHAWLGMSLFTLAFAPLFLCFAPYAFFIRLSRKPDAALALTVLFGVFILAFKLSSAKTPTPMGFIVELMAVRLLAGFATVYFYLRGGALLVSWVGLILQLRFLVALVAGG